MVTVSLGVITPRSPKRKHFGGRAFNSASGSDAGIDPPQRLASNPFVPQTSRMSLSSARTHCMARATEPSTRVSTAISNGTLPAFVPAGSPGAGISFGLVGRKVGLRFPY